MREFTAKGEISKVDDEKKQVFGWASVTDLDGEPVTDRQNDWVATEDLEKAAYDYVLSSRVGGTMHERMEKKSKPKPTSTMIESFVVTPEKIEKMGLPEGSLPLGWWMGFQINDDQTWDRVKKGKLGSFSIHGAGKRKQVDKADIRKSYESTLTRVWNACEGDQILFTKAIAHLTDEAYDRDHTDAHFYEQVLKHLIGSHEQKDHDPSKGDATLKPGAKDRKSPHSRSEHSGLLRSGPSEWDRYRAEAKFRRQGGVLHEDAKEELERRVREGENDPDKLREAFLEKRHGSPTRLSDHEKQILTKFLGS